MTEANTDIRGKVLVSTHMQCLSVRVRGKYLQVKLTIWVPFFCILYHPSLSRVPTWNLGDPSFLGFFVRTRIWVFDPKRSVSVRMLIWVPVVVYIPNLNKSAHVSFWTILTTLWIQRADGWWHGNRS